MYTHVQLLPVHF